MLLTLQGGGGTPNAPKPTTVILTPENLFLFQSDCAAKTLLLNIAFLLLPVFPWKVPQDDLNAT